MNPRYITGEVAEPGDRINRQGDSGYIVCVGAGLAEYGVDPQTHSNYAMIQYDQLGLVCEPLDTEDIELTEKKKK